MPQAARFGRKSEALSHAASQHALSGCMLANARGGTVGEEENVSPLVAPYPARAAQGPISEAAHATSATFPALGR